MFYPVFIVIAFWTSVPLKIAEQTIYLAVCALTAQAIRRRLCSNCLSLILFVLLAFNPVAWNLSFAEVLRQGLYLSLSLALVTLAAAIVFPTPLDLNNNICRAALGIFAGLVGAAYWLTREEGLWLVPALTVIIAVAVTAIFRPRWVPLGEREAFANRWAQLKAIAFPLAIGLIVFAAADWAVAGLNYHYYGVFETNEFRANNFLRAYGALSRIQHDHWRPLIPFPKDARQRAYAVSPAARELANALEGPTGSMWYRIACSFGDAKVCAAGEVESGWAMWEFRDAVAAAGHYRSGAEAMRYYATLADEINSACARGAISCLPPRATMLPPFRGEYVTETLKTSKGVARAVFKMVDGPVGSAVSVGSSEGIEMFADTVDDIYLPEKGGLVVRGWAAAASVTPTVRLAAPTAEQVGAVINLTPGIDVMAAMPSLKVVRFELRPNCPMSSCDLALDVAGSSSSRITLAQLNHPAVNGAVVDTPDLKVYVDGVVGSDNHEFTDLRRAVQVKVAGAIALVYASAFPTLAILGAAGLLLATFFGRRCAIPTSLLALGLGSAVAVGTLLVLFAYLAAASGFGLANVLYTSQATPFVIIFTTVGIYALYVALRDGYRRLSAGEELPIRIRHIGHNSEPPVHASQT
jgi:hypothetical protein